MHISTRHNWFEELSPPAKAELTKHMKVISFAAGERIFDTGATAPNIYQVQSGYVKLFAELEDGTNTLLAIYVPGNIFGETPVICGRPLNHTTIAATDVTLNHIPKVDFESCFNQYGEVSRILCKKLAYILSYAIHFKKAKALYPISTQVPLVLKNLVECSGTKRIGTSQEIDIPITIEEISNFLGVTRQTVQKEITTLKSEGIISKNLGFWKIVDFPKLAAKAMKTDEPNLQIF
ncbi:Crp/Fnr family transcriptional regulator [Hirschia baltica]|uniref:Transcriptional regulator, Crp/Fnr family n=1 Tax=Hirschia baltica (strain ATCC 49814 / DSM 5838 / IFAM 1418) TaxID=582402 RepID=C6XJC0_HIRBI|nr:Crp/Fnr family transcriptional regulator [Hirschia baltica]ACT59215.1 transcriptional regulator, Crp/Fnr family [Hirschia baltica ATCC 49814]